MDEIKKLFSYCEKNMKIYIYNIYPKNFKSVHEFINHVINDKKYDWAETYKSWVYFTHYLLNSKIYTDNHKEADLFLGLQWENYNRGKNYNKDMIRPLERLINSEIYKSTYPLRNHIFIYISDDTPLFEKRLPKKIKEELEIRFIRLTYSGRIPNFGNYHFKKSSVDIFNFNHQNEIVVPCGIPNKFYNKNYKNSYTLNEREIKFYYIGRKNISEDLVERKSIIDLIKKHTSIDDDKKNLYGIHAGGMGIWTARFYDYLQLGIIPVFQSDGVIMPFERFFNYESFSIKLLSFKNNDDNIKHLLEVDKSNINIKKMLDNIAEIKDFFNWNSLDKYKNPFTLIIIELYDYVKINNNETKYISIKSYISKKEFCDTNSKKDNLYRKIIHMDLPDPSILIQPLVKKVKNLELILKNLINHLKNKNKIEFLSNDEYNKLFSNTDYDNDNENNDSLIINDKYLNLYNNIYFRGINSELYKGIDIHK